MSRNVACSPVASVGSQVMVVPWLHEHHFNHLQACLVSTGTVEGLIVQSRFATNASFPLLSAIGPVSKLNVTLIQYTEADLGLRIPALFTGCSKYQSCILQDVHCTSEQ